MMEYARYEYQVHNTTINFISLNGSFSTASAFLNYHFI
jgi:hypothetical protein